MIISLWSAPHRTCPFWRHPLISGRLWQELSDSRLEVFTHRRARTFFRPRALLPPAVRSAEGGWKVPSGKPAAVIIAVHVYSRGFVAELDFKLWRTLRRCWPRHRDVTAAHVTGSPALGRKQFYYATVTMEPGVVTCLTGLLKNKLRIRMNKDEMRDGSLIYCGWNRDIKEARSLIKLAPRVTAFWWTDWSLKLSASSPQHQ